MRDFNGRLLDIEEIAYAQIRGERLIYQLAWG